MEIQKGFVSYLRNSARQQRESRSLSCPLCETEIQPDIEAFRTHVKADSSKHPGLQEDAQIEEAFQKISLQTAAMTKGQPESANRTSRKRPVSGTQNGPDDAGDPTVQETGSEPEDTRRGSKKLRSPPASDVQQRGSSPPTSSHTRAKPSDSTGDFDKSHVPRNTTGRTLWDSEDASQTRPSQARSTQRARTQWHPPPQQRSNRLPHHQQSRFDAAPGSVDDDPPAIIRQPETRPISQEQLVSEVKGIYAGLVMVESKCIEVDNAQSARGDDSPALGNEQWQALIALHRTLLHEHHDFFLASQHPAASAALRRLASKYAMPARMWRHGIHSFLELLRHRLPTSLEHMLTFIYLAYSMMALLYETVPAFEDTWIECLGDLGRYRMAIEDDDIRDREVWTGVSRYWYSKASDKAPTTGRLHHHLAILARPNALQQLYYYVKSLCVPIPFHSARESIMTLFDLVLGANTTRLASIDAAFVRVHAILFSGKSPERLEESMKEFLGLLDGHIGRTTKSWLESGYFIGISLSCSLLGYGAESNILMKAMAQQTPMATEDSGTSKESSKVSESIPKENFDEALSFFVSTYEIVISRWGDTNTLPFLHTTLVFLYHLSKHPLAMAHIQDKHPWKLTALMLNYLKKSSKLKLRMDSSKFPTPEKNEPPRPLPEDHAMRGLIYAEEYFPNDWFSNKKMDEDEKYFELKSMNDERRERILWIARRIASSGKWLVWNDADGVFSAAKPYDVPVEGIPTGLPDDAVSFPEITEPDTTA